MTKPDGQFLPEKIATTFIFTITITITMLCYSSPNTVDLEMTRVPKTSSGSGAVVTYYDRNHEEDWCKVVTTQPDGSVLSQHIPHEPRSYLGLAVVVLVCFNIPFGILAVILSVKANRDYEKGDCTRARVKGKVSMVLSIVGIISTMTAVFLVIFWPAIKPDKG